jgi:hypothetical protein
MLAQLGFGGPRRLQGAMTLYAVTLLDPQDPRLRNDDNS